jgi:hypothetical protein
MKLSIFIGFSANLIVKLGFKLPGWVILGSIPRELQGFHNFELI